MSTQLSRCNCKKTKGKKKDQRNLPYLKLRERKKEFGIRLFTMKLTKIRYTCK